MNTLKNKLYIEKGNIWKAIKSVMLKKILTIIFFPFEDNMLAYYQEFNIQATRKGKTVHLSSDIRKILKKERQHQKDG